MASAEVDEVRAQLEKYVGKPMGGPAARHAGICHYLGVRPLVRRSSGNATGQHCGSLHGEPAIAAVDRRTKRWRRGNRLIAATLILVASIADAEPYAVGSTLPRTELPDQYGETRVIDDSVRFVVFSRDMDAGKVVRAAVEKMGPNLFDRNRAVYVVNVTGMPAIIRSLFAMPALRRRPYRVLVDEEGKKTADFPGGATYPTVMVLDKLKVMSLSYPTNAEALSALLEPRAQ